jgi:hypothetical protein
MKNLILLIVFLSILFVVPNSLYAHCDTLDGPVVAGEGASFEGLKPAGEVEPIVKAADETIEKGSIDELNKKITAGTEERFNRVIATIKHKDESVEAGREYVEAYVDFMHYVERLYNVVSKSAGHHEHEEKSGEHYEY